MTSISIDKYYIDRRQGVDMTLPKSYYSGNGWMSRGEIPYEFLREVVINSNNVFIEVNDE